MVSQNIHTHSQWLCFFIGPLVSKVILVRHGAKNTSELRLPTVWPCSIVLHLHTILRYFLQKGNTFKKRFDLFFFVTLSSTVLSLVCLLKVVSNVWCGAMSDGLSVHTPMMITHCSKSQCWGSSYNRVDQSAGSEGGGAHEEDLPRKVSVTTQSVLITFPFDE